MPLRLCHLLAPRVRPVEHHAVSILKSFHTFAALRAEGAANHYEALSLSPTATPAEIKKQFYSLSKTHHPDHNPDDPNASERFVKISEAYAILGNTQRRERYDREHMRHRQSSGGGRSRPGQGTSSSGPAGGRPASGLSRRRTQFRGPPPSFYRSGGWGAHHEKRQSQANASAETGSTSSGGGFAPGEEPRARNDDVPHFDRHSHTRTQEHQDWRRQRRTTDESIPTGTPGSILTNFFFVGGIITIAVGLTAVGSSGVGQHKKEGR
ncbi:MAG: hypothetical protein M4579_005936 [Chaenotheca gracillima]|nr:MAG: hypothetical protein M4579_005936 [Chaenotheca gracillima]